MRVIIEKNYEELARWAARHVVETIKAFQPTAEKPFVLGLPTGSSTETQRISRQSALTMSR